MDFKIIENNLYVTEPSGKRELVSFEEVSIENMNCIRIYPSEDPDIYNFQFRAKQSLKGKQKKRNVVATVQFSIEGLEEVLEFMKEQKHQKLLSNVPAV